MWSATLEWAIGRIWKCKAVGLVWPLTFDLLFIHGKKIPTGALFLWNYVLLLICFVGLGYIYQRAQRPKHTRHMSITIATHMSCNNYSSFENGPLSSSHWISDTNDFYNWWRPLFHHETTELLMDWSGSAWCKWPTYRSENCPNKQGLRIKTTDRWSEWVLRFNNTSTLVCVM